MTRVLHVPAPVDATTPADAKQIPSECGHFCTASERTHDLLSQPADHVVVCINCVNDGLMDDLLKNTIAP